MPYTLPTADQLKTRYPAFSAVADETVEAAIQDASRSVDTTWVEGDYQPAVMALAAHMMTMEGTGADVQAQLKGFKRLKVGPLELERDGSGSSVDAGGYGSTVYGQQYARLLMLNKAGPRVVVVGTP